MLWTGAVLLQSRLVCRHLQPQVAATRHTTHSTWTMNSPVSNQPQSGNQHANRVRSHYTPIRCLLQQAHITLLVCLAG